MTNATDPLSQIVGVIKGDLTSGTMSREAAAAALAAAARDRGCPEPRLDDLLQDPIDTKTIVLEPTFLHKAPIEDKTSGAEAQAADPKSGRERTVKRSLPRKSVDADLDSQGANVDDDPRTKIVVTTREHEVIDKAIGAIAGDQELFQRGGELVRILDDDSASRKKCLVNRPLGSPRITSLPPAQIRELLTRQVTFLKKVKDGNHEDAVRVMHPPPWVVEGIATRGSWRDVRSLEGVIVAPTIRSDGSVIDQPGYDEATGLFLKLDLEMPTITNKPMESEVAEAVSLLHSVVVDFPFADADHKAVWVAALLTAVGRFAIDGPCPLFLFDANTAGSGKTKLADIIGIVAAGAEMARCGFSDDQAEMEKMILSLVLAGDRLVLFDNIATGAAIGGSALDRALTVRTVKGRILGRSVMSGNVPLNAIFFATGNNLTLRGDALRRVVPCRLESPDEKPEERRKFMIEGDLIDYVKRERGRLVAAALTILRAYFVAGMPDQNLTPIDYPKLSKLIRNAVHWATGADPCGGRKMLAAQDEDLTLFIGLLNGWKELCEMTGGSSRSVHEALKVLDEQPQHHALLRETLLSWSKDSRLPSAGSVGSRLGKYRGRILDGKKLDYREHGGTRYWFVKGDKASGGS